MEGRNFVVLRQAVLAGRAGRSAALQVLVVAAGLEQQDLVAGLGKPGGDDAAACAGTDDDVFEFSAVRPRF